MSEENVTPIPSETNAVIEQLIERLAGTFESEEFLREVVTQSVLKIQRNEPVEPNPYMDHVFDWFETASPEQKDELMDARATREELDAFVGYSDE